MDGLKVFWTRIALNQRNSIFKYWNKRNGNSEFSKKLNISIKQRIEILRAQPLSGVETEVYGVRSVAMRHYSIFYALSKNKLFIVSFWDNRQDPETLLKLLKK